MTHPLSKGTLLKSGTYHVEDVLGQGGFGVVYLAAHQQLQTLVAIKATADSDTDAQRAFLDEARLLSRLRHPHLPRVTDYFIEGQQPYLVMDYIAGEDLEQVLAKRGGHLSEAEALPLALQVLEALAFLHGQNLPVIHRDIKPANIRIAPDGTIYLVDFGIAKVGGGGTHTQIAARAISAPFSPPEQYGGAIRTDTYSDVYALGATLYVLFTGVLPPESVARQAGGALTPLRLLNSSVGEGVERVVMRALEIDARARFPSAREFLDALKHPSGAAVLPVPGRSCPCCGKPPMTPNAPFCHACGTPILLAFASLGRQIDNPADLVAACDQSWQDALKLLQNGILLRWLDAHGQQAFAARLREAQARHPNDTAAALEAFLRPTAPQGLDLNPPALDFGACGLDAVTRLTVVVHRRHPGYIHGRVRAETPWITVAPEIIRMQPHETSATLIVSAATAQLASGDAQRVHAGAITISANHGTLRLPLQITVSNPPRPRLQPPSVQLGRVEAVRRASGSIAIINEGGGVVNGVVRAEQPWLTVEAHHARFSLGYYQHATVNFSVTTEQLSPKGTHRGTLVWETDHGIFVSDITIEIVPPYAVEPGDSATEIRQPSDLIRLCDYEPRRGINNWERGCAWLRAGRITAALRFFADEALVRHAETCTQLQDVNIGLEHALRALGAKPAREYKDNSRDVVKQITGLLSRKPQVVEYAILNTSKRGYLHGCVQPLAPWISIPEPRFGCMPDEEAVVKLYPDYKRRSYGDLFEPLIE